MAKRRRGRVPAPESRKTVTSIKFSPAERAWLQRQAEREGLTFSAFVRSKAIAACPGFDPSRAPSAPMRGQRAIPGTGVSDAD